jgi:hypothetical protein
VILGAVALPWAGCALWQAHRESAAKEALAAEIRAEMAARSADPDRTAGRVDLTEEYGRILAGFVRGSPADALQDEDEDESDDRASPEATLAAVEAALAHHGDALALLDARVERGGDGHLRMGADGLPWNRLSRLLLARGRARLAQGDGPGLFRTVRAFLRVSDDFRVSSHLEVPIVPLVYGLVWKRQALRLLEEAAVSPALTEAAALEALALAGGPWTLTDRLDPVEVYFRDGFDQFCLELLGPDPMGELRNRRLVDDDSFLERAERVLEFRGRGGRVGGPPSAATIRRMRGFAARYWEARARKDGAAFAPGGPFDGEATLDLGGGWTPGRLGFRPAGARNRWEEDAHLPVLRAALAIRIHEARTGRLPETLDELVPSILDAVPVDPWTGKPVRYAPKPGGGWILEAGPPRASFTHPDGEREDTAPWTLER